MADSVTTFDIGNNATNALTAIAKKLNTTVEQVFPWYVTQARLRGILDLVSLVIFFTLMVYLFKFFMKKVQDGQENDEEPILWSVAAVTTMIATAIGAIIGLTYFSDIVTAILNPKYAAVTALLKSVK